MSEVVKLLKDAAGYTDNEIAEKFVITENPKEYIVKAIDYLDAKTFKAIAQTVGEKGGGYIPGKTATFTIPKTPSAQAMDSQPIYKETGNETPYNLETSMRGLGQLVPVLEDAQGNIIDGFHRVEIDKTWPRLKIERIDNTVKLELARLATNYCRRTMDKTELEQKIGFLIGSGLTVQAISQQTGMSERTIYRYIPQDLKKPSAEKISETMKATSDVVRKELTPVSSYPKTQDTFVSTPAFARTQEEMAQQVIDCEACGKPMDRSRGTIVGGKIVCPKCAGKDKPPIPATAPQPPKKDYKETGDYRKGLMHPQKSKFELAVIQDLQAEGIPLETDVEICAVKTTPDAILRLQKGNIAIYIDNEATHPEGNGRDEFLRDKITMHGWKVLPVRWKNDSVEERQRAKEQIREYLKW